MGVNTDAILFWGIAYNNKDHFDEDLNLREIYEVWEEKYAATKGITEPTEEYFGDAAKAKHHEYWEKKSTAIESSGCKMDAHCCPQEEMVYVPVTPSIIKNARGSISEIKSLAVDPYWEPALKDFCKALGLPWREPKWYLVSWWG